MVHIKILTLDLDFSIRDPQPAGTQVTAVSPLGIWLLELSKEEISISDPMGIDLEFNSKSAFSEKCMLSRHGDMIREAPAPDFSKHLYLLALSDFAKCFFSHQLTRSLQESCKIVLILPQEPYAAPQIFLSPLPSSFADLLLG